MIRPCPLTTINFNWKIQNDSKGYWKKLNNQGMKVEELIRQEAKHSAEFRNEMRREVREMRGDIKELHSKHSRLDGKLALIVAVISGGVSYLAKKMGIG